MSPDTAKCPPREGPGRVPTLYSPVLRSGQTTGAPGGPASGLYGDNRTPAGRPLRAGMWVLSFDTQQISVKTLWHFWFLLLFLNSFLHFLNKHRMPTLRPVLRLLPGEELLRESAARSFTSPTPQRTPLQSVSERGASYPGGGRKAEGGQTEGAVGACRRLGAGVAPVSAGPLPAHCQCPPPSQRSQLREWPWFALHRGG